MFDGGGEGDSLITPFLLLPRRKNFFGKMFVLLVPDIGGLGDLVLITRFVK